MSEPETKPTEASVEDFLARLPGKSCLYIRNLNQVELPVLEALIGESVRAMSRQRVDR